MWDVVEARFRSLLRPRPEEAEALREALTEGLVDLPGADALLLRTEVDPVLLGRVTRALLGRDDVADATKARACEALFDAIPLPDREDEAFLTPATVPPTLQEAARYLARRGDFGDYHLLHLVYALYLDPDRAASAPLSVLRENLDAVLTHEAEAAVKLLYVGFLLAAPGLRPEEARALFETALAAETLAEEARARLCQAALDPEQARSWLGELARREGLFAPKETPEEPLLREVRLRPLPEAVREPAEAWLRARGR